MLNSNFWRQVYSETKTREPVPNRPNTFYPVPAFEIPFLLDATILSVRTFSTTARFTWKYAGYLSAVTRVSPGIPPTILERVTLPINRTQLVVFKKYISSYELIFEPFYWFASMGLEIWEYYGSDSATDLESSIELIKNTLNRLEEKVDDISTYP
ncbi:MAG: hypothetical protein N3E45_17130 [Oscillatoriaceae bacterium SKW80]|nr:hypothetical protein [Oscillatoriaceae bacterium SKW80]HIK27959.1 hypothetical protein [Oscillatoriaceae cyanobacterium M7585_C2015_266]